jgi:hypothetical protein
MDEEEYYMGKPYINCLVKYTLFQRLSVLAFKRNTDIIFLIEEALLPYLKKHENTPQNQSTKEGS